MDKLTEDQIEELLAIEKKLERFYASIGASHKYPELKQKLFQAKKLVKETVYAADSALVN